jgi:hypothetical protein
LNFGRKTFGHPQTKFGATCIDPNLVKCGNVDKIRLQGSIFERKTKKYSNYLIERVFDRL